MAQSNTPSLIRAMLRPDFYPHPATSPVQLLQTHISYVLLTGDYAYKVKKPVDLGFLDFSTLDRRRHFCFEELRLNARGAPGLYLEVTPITRDGGGFRLDGPGETVEYAVKMRQFPQDSLCRAMLEKGVLADGHVLSLAATVARYHTGAATADDYVASFGTPPRLRDALDQNYRGTERFAGGPQTRLQFDETRAFTDQFLRERQELFLGRIRGGRVRECHGNLHLNNICSWEGNILLFDCIEFSEALRFVDTRTPPSPQWISRPGAGRISPTSSSTRMPSRPGTGRRSRLTSERRSTRFSQRRSPTTSRRWAARCGRPQPITSWHGTTRARGAGESY